MDHIRDANGQMKTMHGAGCHVGYRSCFYRHVVLENLGTGTSAKLAFNESEKVFDPISIYGEVPNPTIL